MAKKIVLNYEGKDYTLEFNRRIVRQMEADGFRIDANMPVTLILDLFKGAFKMHHRKLPAETIEDMWDAQRDKDKLLSALVSMYSEPVAALMDEPEDEGDDANPTWKEV